MTPQATVRAVRRHRGRLRRRAAAGHRPHPRRLRHRLRAGRVYTARWFGVGLLAIGLTTWLARDAADSAGGLAIARAFTVSYGIGVVLALWGTLAGPFNALGWIAVGLSLILGAGFASL